MLYASLLTAMLSTTALEVPHREEVMNILDSTFPVIAEEIREEKIHLVFVETDNDFLNASYTGFDEPPVIGIECWQDFSACATDAITHEVGHHIDRNYDSYLLNILDLPFSHSDDWRFAQLMEQRLAMPDAMDLVDWFTFHDRAYEQKIRLDEDAVKLKHCLVLQEAQPEIEELRGLEATVLIRDFQKYKAIFSDCEQYPARDHFAWRNITAINLAKAHKTFKSENPYLHHFVESPVTLPAISEEGHAVADTFFLSLDDYCNGRKCPYILRSIQLRGLDKFITYPCTVGYFKLHDQKLSEQFAALVYSVAKQYVGPIQQETMRIVPSPELLTYLENVSYKDKYVLRDLVEKYRSNLAVQEYWETNGFVEQNK